MRSNRSTHSHSLGADLPYVAVSLWLSRLEDHHQPSHPPPHIPNYIRKQTPPQQTVFRSHSCTFVGVITRVLQLLICEISICHLLASPLAPLRPTRIEPSGWWSYARLLPGLCHDTLPWTHLKLGRYT